MPGPRVETKRRARAVQLLYAAETTGRPIRELLQGFTRLTGPEPAVLDGAETLAEGVLADREAIDQLCQEAVDHWRLGRLGTIERTILRLAIHELREGVTPPKVVIDEALYLAHRFGSERAAAFVNGVLDRVARTLGCL